uniref:Syntaxin-18 n=1 Tax=Caligus clemensi TaxID=344056 RepID=C1C125_CALCM|nr:Syntaxin-18 [Caligus clemensi]
MVDITSDFRACLHDARKRIGSQSLDKNRILKTRAAPHAFSIRAKDILSDIKRVEDFLTEENVHRLSSEEVDDIETGALSILRTTKQLIGKFKKDLESNAAKMNSQVKSHFTGVAEVLEKKLRTVEDVFMRQRSLRIEDLSMKREMSRLQDAIGLVPPPTEGIKTPILQDEDDQDEGLSPEELQLFQRENATMYESLLRTQNEVPSIENKVVKIAELQEPFSEKILQQKDDIELVSRNALAASENIKDGNEELRKAIQNKASIRVYILFSLLVLSFSLLFLDWYNP